MGEGSTMSLQVTPRLAASLTNPSEAQLRKAQLEDTVTTQEAFAKHHWKREQEQISTVNGLIQQYEKTTPIKPRTTAPPCSIQSEAVLGCYRENDSAPYKCRELVAAFAACSKLVVQTSK